MSNPIEPPQDPGANQPNYQAGPPPGWQQPPPQKSRFWKNCMILGGIGLLVLVVGIVGCTALVGKAVNDVDKSNKKVHTITYKVTGKGSGKADLTYTVDGTGTIEQRNGEALPWSKTIKLKGTFNFLDISAQNSLETGSVTCTITVDGVVKKKATSHGQFAIADCNGLQ